MVFSIKNAVGQGRGKIGRAVHPYGVRNTPAPSFVSVLDPGQSATIHEEKPEYQRLSMQLEDGTRLDYCIVDGQGACILEASLSGECATLPDRIDGLDVIALGERCFFGCSQLRSVTLPSSLAVIGPFAFSGTALEQIDLPDSLLRIDTKAFFNCRALNRAQGASRLEVIGTAAFRLTALESFFVPSTVNEIGFEAFDGTPMRFSQPDPTFVLDECNPFYAVDGCGVLYRLFNGYSVLQQILDSETTDVVVRQDCATIGQKAFFSHECLERVTLSDAVTLIEAKAFQYCDRLRTVGNTAGLVKVGNHAFQGTSLESFQIGACLETLGECSLFTGESPNGVYPPFLKHLSVSPDNPRYYLVDDMLCERRESGGDRLLIYAGEGPEVVIPHEVDEIGPYAFANVEGVSKVTLHDGIGRVDLCGLSLGDSMRSFVLLSDKFEDGHIDFFFPAGTQVKGTVRSCFYKAAIDPAEMMEVADMNVRSCAKTFDWAVYAMHRLRKPYFLNAYARDVFESGLRNKLEKIALEFARRRYMQGFDDLADLGFIDMRNVSLVVEALSANEEIEAVGYLMRLKRDRFGTPAGMDFDL